MVIHKRNLKQKAVWWDQDTNPSNYGQPTYITGKEINVRWEDKNQEFIDSNGDRRISRAVIILDREISVGDMLFKGKSADISDLTDPRAEDDAWEVKRVESIPNLRNLDTLYVAMI